MTLKQKILTFEVDLESELNNTLPEGSMVYCCDTKKTWKLSNGSFTEIKADPFLLKAVLASDVSTGANVTPVNVTGLVFNFEANAKYIIEIFGIMQSPANTTGYGLQFDTSVAVTTLAINFFHQLANTGTTTGGSSIADDTSVGLSTGVPTNATNVPLYGSGILIAGANAGTAQLRLRSEVAAVATMKANSIMRIMKI